MVITRAADPSACTTSRSGSRSGASARGRPGARDLRRQGQRVPLDGVLPQDLRRARARGSRTSRRDHHYVDATALDLIRKPWDVRRAGHREHVRRHPVRPGRGARRRHGHGAVGRHRRPARPVPALPRLRARHRGPGQGQPDGDDPVGGDDARLARRSSSGIDALARGGAAPRARGRRGVRVGGALMPFELGGRDGTRGDRRRRGVATCRNARWTGCASLGRRSRLLQPVPVSRAGATSPRSSASASSTATPTKARALAARVRHRARLRRRSTPMLDAARPDLVDIITPPPTHARVRRAGASRAASRSICQKPLRPRATRKRSRSPSSPSAPACRWSSTRTSAGSRGTARRSG